MLSKDYPLEQQDKMSRNMVEYSHYQGAEHGLIDNAEFPLLDDANLDHNILVNLNKGISMISRIDAKHNLIFEPSNHPEEMIQKLMKLTRTLKSLQIHLNFILEVLSASSEEDIPEVVSKYKPISRHYKPIRKREDICLFLINEAFNTVIFAVIKEAEKATDTFFMLQADGKIVINKDKQALDCVQIITSKLETTIEYFPEAATLESHDIFAHKRDSEPWKKLSTRAETIVLADKEVLNARWKKMYAMLNILNAVVYSNHNLETMTLKDRLSSTYRALYFGAKLKEAELKASLHISDPKMSSAFQVWNFMENGWVKEIKKLALPTIDYDRKLYIHRLFPSITREGILKEYEEGTLNKIQKNTFKPINLIPKKNLILESIFSKQADAVRMRLIAPYPLVLKGINSEKARAMAMKAINNFNQFLKRGKQEDMKPDGIIIHIHGGGFVSGSSSSHRNYLYRWAKSLNRVIFSIDYRLAPDYQYPAALDDIWQAYNWIINYAEPLLGIKSDKIVVTGDSAGGNLALALTLRTIKMGIQVPDGCMLSYPALNLYAKRFVPSYYMAIDDVILPYSLLKLCIKAYIPEEFCPMVDPFLSPVMASDEMLSKLPPVRIITGSIDPLHDDSWRLLHRMQALEKDVKMIVYDNMPHGFMSFDQIEEHKTVVDDSCKVLAELFLNQQDNERGVEEGSSRSVSDKDL
jgi:hormone-sensitive lipase